MRFVLTYEDITRWMQNFLDIELKIEAFNAESGEFTVNTPAIGVRKLLPDSYRQYKQLFRIEEYNTNSVIINISGLYERDEVFCNMLTKYVNYCTSAETIELIQHGRIKIHLDKIEQMHRIELQSLTLTKQGLEIEFAENLNLYEHLRMTQTLLRARYTRVHVIPEDMPYSGYWFSDDCLEYTLMMADHPADIRLRSSVHVMEWLGIERNLSKESFHPLYPTTQIDSQYGDINVTIPVTIAYKEINVITMIRNCQRMKEEMAGVMATILDILGQTYNNHREL